MLKRIRIKGFKSLKDVEVELKPLTVLFGPNASGKSNFLDALYLLSRLESSNTVQAAFDYPFRGKPLETFTLGEGGIKGLIEEKKDVSFSIEVDIEVSESVIGKLMSFYQVNAPELYNSKEEIKKIKYLEAHRRLRYYIALGYNHDSGSIRVKSRYFKFLTKEWRPIKKKSPIYFKERPPILSDHMNRWRSTLHKQGILDSYRLLFIETFSRWHFFYFEPRTQMRAPNPFQGRRTIGTMGEELPSFLRTLENGNPKGFQSLNRALNHMVPSVDGVETFVNDEGDADFRLIEDGRKISSRLVSEGTLRVLGFLAVGVINPTPFLIGFEEPENGIHPRRIRLLADYFKAKALHGETQIIVATHSPILIEEIPKEYLFVCRKKNGFTVIDPFESLGPLGRKISSKKKIKKALMDAGEPLSIPERILRGDFDNE